MGPVECVGSVDQGTQVRPETRDPRPDRPPRPRPPGPGGPANADADAGRPRRGGAKSTRFFLYDRAGAVLGSWQIAHQPVMPRPGWVEHEPEVILANTLGCIDHVMAEVASQGVEVAVKGLGITNQRETTLAWDRATGEALCNAISWNDLRTSELSARLAAEHGGKDALRATTGLPFSTYFAALKIKWLMENDAKVQAAVAAGTCCFGTVDSWLIYKLTGGAAGGAYVTDVTNASRYLLMDLASLAWDPACLALFGLTEAMLPRIVSCAEPYGAIAAGPLQGVPVCGCVGDQQASTLGQRCKVGEAKVRTLRPLCSRRSGPLWADGGG